MSDKEREDGIVAALTLLFDGIPEGDRRQLFARSLPERVKWVCQDCGGDSLSHRGSYFWDETTQCWMIEDCDKNYCIHCDSEVDDRCVSIDWEPENKSEMKPTDDP